MYKDKREERNGFATQCQGGKYDSPKKRNKTLLTFKVPCIAW